MTMTFLNRPKTTAGIRLLCAGTALTLSSSLVGCGMNGSPLSTTGATVTPGALSISGGVRGGLQPVVGALMQLYEVGSTGYGTAAKPILTKTVTTDQNGLWNITGDYTCDAGSYVYITAAGGNSGAGTNNNLTLMALLGSCSALKANAATTFVYIDEVTTTASAYAMAQFSGGSSIGTTQVAKPGSGGTAAPADNFATSSTNIQGVANAMGVYNVLVNNSTGASPGTNQNGTATVESYTINTIADILSACVNSTGGTASGTMCGNIFAASTPVGGTAPADTFQVALQLALHPGDANLLAGTPSGSTLDAFIPANAPYTPYVNTSVTGNTINDWTIAVSYVPVTPATTTPLLSAANSVAIDGFGNAWITNVGNGHVVELAPNGDPIQAGAASGLYYVSSYSVSGTATPITGGNTPIAAVYGIAIDNENDAWAADYGGGYIFKIGASAASFGTNGEISTFNGGGGTAATALAVSETTAPQSGSHPTEIAIDGSDSLYTGLYGNGGASPTGATGASCNGSSPFTAGTKNIVTFVKNSGGTYGTGIIGNSSGSNAPYIAIDNGNTDVAGGTVIPGSPFVYTLGEGSASGEGHSAGATGHYGLLFQNYTVTNATAGSLQGCQTPIASITSAGYTGTATTKITQNANGGDTTDLFNNAFAVAFDASNNLWSINQTPTDANATYSSSLTKLTLAYGNAYSSANATANSTFATYTAGGLLASGFKAQSLVIDGAGSAFAANVGTSPIVTATSNTGTALAPTTGYVGATYSASGATEVKRAISTAANLAVDISGNLWIPSGAATVAAAGPPSVASVPATNVVQIVGVAAPVVAPTAKAVGGSLGIKP